VFSFMTHRVPGDGRRVLTEALATRWAAIGGATLGGNQSERGWTWALVSRRVRRGVGTKACSAGTGWGPTMSGCLNCLGLCPESGQYPKQFARSRSSGTGS